MLSEVDVELEALALVVMQRLLHQRFHGCACALGRSPAGSIPSPSCGEFAEAISSRHGNRAPQVAIPPLYFFLTSCDACLRNIGRRRFAAFARSQRNDTSMRSASSSTSMVGAAVWPSARM